jgi:hypothetical protein
MKQYLLLTILASSLFLLILNSCSSPKQDAGNIVDAFYKSYKGDFRTCDKNSITVDLAIKIDSAIVRERQEVQKMAASAYPTDKPDMIEGDIFTSLYDGYTSFKIAEIKIEQNKAVVSVGFTYKEKNPKFNDIIWVDNVVLVQENGWKIDNVLYKGNNCAVASLKEELDNFLNAE